MTNVSEVMTFIGTVCYRGFFLVTSSVKKNFTVVFCNFQEESCVQDCEIVQW